MEERIAYCKESVCCYVFGNGDLSNSEKSELKHRRCNYKSPTDRFLTKCTAWRSKNAQGRKLFCYFGAALCLDHQNIKNCSPQLLDWLKASKIRHDMFTVDSLPNQFIKMKGKKCKPKDHEHISDREAHDMLKTAMKDNQYTDNSRCLEI